MTEPKDAVDIGRLVEIYRSAVKSNDTALTQIVHEAAINAAIARSAAAEATALQEYALGILAESDIPSRITRTPVVG